MRYRINWRYWSSLCEAWGLGELAAGSTVDLTEAQAEAINRDSPGVLTLDRPKPAPTREAKPQADRQVKAAGRSRATKSRASKG